MTTVEQIAAQAGVSRRSCFRNFDSKAAVLWHEFDQGVAALREAFVAIDPTCRRWTRSGRWTRSSRSRSDRPRSRPAELPSTAGSVRPTPAMAA
ncbi:TetR family transcriptional regulator [Mycobacterium sp.]|uniref:TetR family transcriptional regulator n=1 Tax=Mycobacterium sp. TaxID=1785 RepID=UPI0037C89CDD